MARDHHTVKSYDTEYYLSSFWDQGGDDATYREKLKDFVSQVAIFHQTTLVDHPRNGRIRLVMDLEDYGKSDEEIVESLVSVLLNGKLPTPPIRGTGEYTYLTVTAVSTKKAVERKPFRKREEVKDLAVNA